MPSRPSEREIVHAEIYVKIALYASSAISAIFSPNIAASITLRVAQLAWDRVPATSRPPFDVFTEAHFPYMWSSTDARQPGLPLGCVSLLSPSSPDVKYFDAPLYGEDGSPKHYVVDAPMPPAYRAVPLTHFSPYAVWSQQRNNTIRDRISPIPILFFETRSQNISFGVPVDRAATADVQLLNGSHELDVLKSKTSLKIKFHVRLNKCFHAHN